MASEVDPFTQIYTTLWNLLLANSDFTSRVPISNCIAYVDVTYEGTTLTASREPRKPSHLAADYPQVEIEAVEDEMRMYETSDGTTLTAVFGINVLTGDKRMQWIDASGIDHGINPLKWAIFRSLMEWLPTMTALTYGSTAFVTHCETHGGAGKLDLPGEHREETVRHKRPAGWVTVWRGSVEMVFKSVSILPA